MRRTGNFSQKIKQIQRIVFPARLASSGIAGILHVDFLVRMASSGILGIFLVDLSVNAVSPGIRSIFLAYFPASFILIVSEKKPTSGRKLAGMCVTQTLCISLYLSWVLIRRVLRLSWQPHADKKRPLCVCPLSARTLPANCHGSCDFNRLETWYTWPVRSQCIHILLVELWIAGGSV